MGAIRGRRAAYGDPNVGPNEGMRDTKSGDFVLINELINKEIVDLARRLDPVWIGSASS